MLRVLSILIAILSFSVEHYIFQLQFSLVINGKVKSIVAKTLGDCVKSTVGNIGAIILEYVNYVTYVQYITAASRLSCTNMYRKSYQRTSYF